MTYSEPVAASRGRSAMHGARRFIARNPRLVWGGLLLAAIVFIGVLAPVIATHDPTVIAPARKAQLPSADHWFGTDLLGRDIFSRVIHGTQVSLIIGFSSAFLATALGLVLGTIAGFVRWIDSVVMRVMDGLMSIPSILLAIALTTLYRGSMFTVVLAIAIAEVPQVTRLARSVVLTLRDRPFVDSAITAGCTTFQTMRRHILPNLWAPLLVQATFVCGAAMLLEAALSFIGAGTPPSTPSWGNVMADGRTLWQVRPLAIFFPALFLSLTVLSINMVGDGLRDLLDPRRPEAGP